VTGDQGEAVDVVQDSLSNDAFGTRALAFVF